MTRARFAHAVLALAMVAIVAGCNSRPNPTAPNYTFFPGPDSGSMLGDEGISFLFGDKNKKGQGGGGPGAGIGVNAYLWRAALDTRHK